MGRRGRARARRDAGEAGEPRRPSPPARSLRAVKSIQRLAEVGQNRLRAPWSPGTDRQFPPPSSFFFFFQLPPTVLGQSPHPCTRPTHGWMFRCGLGPAGIFFLPLNKHFATERRGRQSGKEEANMWGKSKSFFLILLGFTEVGGGDRTLSKPKKSFISRVWMKGQLLLQSAASFLLLLYIS